MVLGVTGGVGAGKSVVLEFLKNEYHATILMADDIAKTLLAPGGEAIAVLKERFPATVFTGDGEIDREKMAAFIFQNPEKRAEMNGVVFPLVRQYICEKISRSAPEELVVIEAALLIEEHYDEICDVMWYIYSSEDHRRRRLMENRGYSEARIRAMMKSQLTEQQFKAGCDVVIDNDGSLEDTYAQIKENIQTWKDKMER
ncbi:dephospho-CoA kinase [Lachnospiraceae bacterium XBB1006]|nr:dephospho-CoA kinase [Lachnospiraceae bacterium XBB1006]